MNRQWANPRSAIRCGAPTAQSEHGSALETSAELPAGAPAVSQARLVVHDVLCGWGFGDELWLDQVAVVVTELVANAVRHTGACLAVTVRADGNQVTVGAVDSSPAHPRRREPDDDSGRGLMLVEGLTARWGVCDHHDGKHVWATFHQTAADR